MKFFSKHSFFLQKINVSVAFQEKKFLQNGQSTFWKQNNRLIKLRVDACFVFLIDRAILQVVKKY